ncbi:MAG: HPr-rel-A system PqqD family peptide chaperone [Deltaproteobacteria bacterium]|nr:HPr-rel-A system PqqD family peptide chaperone [Deltaproteobacteria bacterium]
MTAGTDRLSQLAISPSGFIFDPRSGSTFTVNEPARFILEAIRDGLGLDAIVKTLNDHFAAGAADLRRDTLEFARRLRDSGLLPTDFELV